MVALNLVTSVALLVFLSWIYLKPLFDFTFDTKRYGKFNLRLQSGGSTLAFKILLFFTLGAQVFSAWFVVHRDLTGSVPLSEGFFYAIIALAVAGFALSNLIFFNAVIMLAFPEKAVPNRFERQGLGATIFGFLFGVAIVVLVGLTSVGVAFWVGVAGVGFHFLLTLWYQHYVRARRPSHRDVQDWELKMPPLHYH